MMRALAVWVGMMFAAGTLAPATPPAPTAWRQAVEQEMPLLGHRNWILVVDSAYPLQTSPGIETIDTGSEHLEVVRDVLYAINRSAHVRPVIEMDAELPYVSDEDAPGAGRYRTDIADLIRGYPTSALPHEKILAQVDDVSREFHVLVLKTRMTIPYTSVFIRLDCRYWSGDAEQRLRARMGSGQE
jgi:hypothetical protein